MRKVVIICFIFIVFLIHPVASDVITPNPIDEAGFETITGWSYSEVDTGGYITGERTPPQITEGSYKYTINATNPHPGTCNPAWITQLDYGKIYRTVNFTGIRKITWESSDSYAGWFTLSVSVDSTDISSGEYIEYNDSHTLTIMYQTSGAGCTIASHRLDIDDFIAYNNTIPTTPTISYPTNNSRHYNNSVNFTWNQSSDTENDTISYDFWLSNQSNFSYRIDTSLSSIISQATSTNENTNEFGQTFTTFPSQGDISSISLWLDNSAYGSDWYNLSVWDSPSKGVLLGSKNRTVLTTSNEWVNFTFDSTLTVSGSTQYYFELSNGVLLGDHTFNSSDVYNGGDYYRNGEIYCSCDSTFKIFTSLGAYNTIVTDGVTYYGKVRSFDGYEYSDWSNTVQFTENSKPTVPVLIQHGNFHSNLTTTVNWTASTDNESDVITYDVKVYNTSTGVLALNQTNTSNNYSSLFTLLNWTNYNYSVRSNDSYEFSEWSSVSTFIFNNTVPSYSSITLLPATPSITDNLTISYNVTDIDSDQITNYTRWYKNNVLQSSLNNLLYVNATGNTSYGEVWRYEIFGNDTYANSTNSSSNEVIVGSTNSPPTFTSLILVPSNKKYNKTININASGISDDSATWQVQTYYLNGSTKVYLANSSWITATYSNLTATIPWSDGGLHTIYAVVYDSGNATGVENLTSSPKSTSFTSNISAPILVSQSVNDATINTGDTVIITAQVNGLGANVSTVNAFVRRPDATSANWSMSCGSGEIVNCTYSYTSTSDVGNYYIDYFYAQDDSGNLGQLAPDTTLSFYASTPTVVIPSGSGGGSSPKPTPKVNDSLQDVVLKIQKITPDLPEGLTSIIAECYTKNVLLEPKCTNIDLSNAMNWWPLILGAFFGSVFTILVLAFITRKPRKLLIDALLYGTITVVIIQILVIVGINAHFLNYLFQSDLPGFMFISTVMWSVVVSYAGDYMYIKRKRK